MVRPFTGSDPFFAAKKFKNIAEGKYSSHSWVRLGSSGWQCVASWALFTLNPSFRSDILTPSVPCDDAVGMVVGLEDRR